MQAMLPRAARRLLRLSETPISWWSMLIPLCVVLLAPLAVVDVPPLLDYPNHLARAYVLILVANSGAAPDQAAICRAANCEMRVFAKGVSFCHSATLTRLTATAVMTCCKRVFANPI
jgi:hypothetical protein